MRNEILDKIDDNIIGSHTMEFAAKPPKYALPVIKFLIKKDNVYYLVSILNRYVMHYPNKPDINSSDYPTDVIVYDLRNDESVILKMSEFINSFSLNDKFDNNYINNSVVPNFEEKQSSELSDLLNIFSEVIADKNNIDIEKYKNQYYPNIMKYLGANERKYYSLFDLGKANNLETNDNSNNGEGTLRKYKIDENGKMYEEETKIKIPDLITDAKITMEISKLLDLAITELKANSKRIDESNATYYYNSSRGGKSVIVADDGTYLAAGSATSFERLLEEFNKGRRNGNFLEDNSLKIKCHSCGNEITINTSNIPKNIKTLDTMCPKCQSFIKYGNPNYKEESKCFHKWILTDKLPEISKEWVKQSDGTKKEVYFHIYKCEKCNEEKRMSDEEFSMSTVEGPGGHAPTKEQQDKILQTFSDDKEKIEKTLQEVQQLIRGEHKDFEKAKELLLDIVKDTEVYDNDSTTEYYNFDDVIDFVLYTRLNKPKKNMKWLDTPFTTAYFYLAYISNEEQNFDEALKMIDKTIRWSPMNLGPLFEKCETYKMQKNWEEFKNITLSIYDKIYKASDLAHYYRNLGYYYIEMNNLNLAYALYSASIKFERNQNAYGEMAYINQQLNREKYDMPAEEGLNLLKDNNIPFGPKQENLNRLTEIYFSEKELIKKPNIEMQLAERIYYLTKDNRFAPFYELIDKTTGCSIIVPRSWQPVKEEKRKELCGQQNMFAVYSDNGSLFQANYDGKCSKEKFEDAYKLNVNNMINHNKNINLQVLDEGTLTLKLQQEMKDFKHVLTDVTINDKVVRMIHYFTLINGIFTDFSITLDASIDYKDKQIFNNQKNMRDMINLLSNIIELKVQDDIPKTNNKEELENKIDDNVIELAIDTINTNYKDKKDIKNVFTFVENLFKNNKSGDPFWIESSKNILIYIIVYLLESRDELRYDDVKNILNDKSKYIDICKNATTSLNSDKLSKIIDNTKKLSDKMLDSYYDILIETLRTTNSSGKLVSHNIKFNDDLNFNICFSKDLGELTHPNDTSFKIGNNVTIMNARCNSSELLEKRANEWLQNSAKANNQTILEDLNKSYQLNNNQINVIEKTVTKDSKNRYYKFIYYNQTMLIFGYNKKELSKVIDDAIVGLKAIKKQLKEQRNPFEKPKLKEEVSNKSDENNENANSDNNLKNIILDAAKDFELNDKNDLIESIINKIKELPLNIETTIAKLINYKPEEQMIDPLIQGKVLVIVYVVCDEINIKLEVFEDSIGGLAYNYRFKKIFDENLPYPNCKYCGSPTVLETIEDGIGGSKSLVCSKCGKYQNVD